MSDAVVSPRGAASIWLQAARPFSFTASMVPPLLGAALCLDSPRPVAWPLLAPVLIASLLLHAGTNLVSEYYDYRHSVDRKDTYGSSRVLVEGLLEPKAVLRGGLVLFALALAIGVWLIALRGPAMAILGITGMLGGYLYTGGPKGYKYLALGDLAVFWLMGPLMVLGSYLALAGEIRPRALWVSLPVGCLVTAILHANNTRDIQDDQKVGVRTLANVLGHRRAKFEYYALELGAYGLVLALIALGHLSLWSLLVLLTAVPMVKNLKAMARSREGEPRDLQLLDVQTAQHHFLFGLTLIGSVVLGHFIR